MTRDIECRSNVGLGLESSPVSPTNQQWLVLMQIDGTHGHPPRRGHQHIMVAVGPVSLVVSSLPRSTLHSLHTPRDTRTSKKGRKTEKAKGENVVAGRKEVGSGERAVALALREKRRGPKEDD